MKKQKVAYKQAAAIGGFTLVELLVSTLILMVVIVSLLVSYIRCLELTELSKNMASAINVSRSRMEQIKNTDFDQVATNYNNVSFTSANFNGRGVSYITTVNPDLVQVTITFCWRQTNGRIIGEDQDLDGLVSAGEDMNGNGILDSTVQLVNYIYRL